LYSAGTIPRIIDVRTAPSRIISNVTGVSIAIIIAIIIWIVVAAVVTIVRWIPIGTVIMTVPPPMPIPVPAIMVSPRIVPITVPSPTVPSPVGVNVYGDIVIVLSPTGIALISFTSIIIIAFIIIYIGKDDVFILVTVHNMVVFFGFL